MKHLFSYILPSRSHTLLTALLCLLFPICHQAQMLKTGGLKNNTTVQTLQQADTSKKAYLQVRDMYKKADSLQAFDSDIVLNEVEKQANQKLLRLQRKMIDQYKEENFFPPARYYYKSKEYAEKTQLFKLLKQMPKGGLMHLHTGAMGNFEWIVDRAMTEPNCYVFWQENTDEYTKGQLQFFKPKDAPKGFRLVEEVKAEVPDFADQLYDLLTFDVSMNEDSVDIWYHFERHFSQTGRFFTYAPINQAFLETGFEVLISDNIQHVELRHVMSRGTLYDLENPEGYYTADSVIHNIQAAIKATQSRHPEFTCKIIFTDIRFFSADEVYENFERAYQFRKKYPNLIKGYDLVAEEDAGNTTLYYLKNWMNRSKLEAQYGIDLPLLLHDGESDWVSVENLYDAVMLNCKRIGHGFNLFRFPSLMKQVKKQDICIEINPLSSQILGYIRDLRIHPASYYMNQGIALTISPDDPAVFDYQGVTPDFWAIFLAWELDLEALKKLCLNSIDYSTLSEKEKRQALRIWNYKWNQWVEMVNETL